MRNYENYERKRNVYVGFRLTKEEKEKLDKFVAVSGLTEREYVAKRALQEDVVVVGNTRVYKALNEQMNEIVRELKRLNKGSELSDDFICLIRYIFEIYRYMEVKENG